MKKGMFSLESVKLQYRELFFDRDERSRGRLCMLASTIVNSIAANLSGGAFYSAFLLEYGINLTNIGIITFIPYIASLFTILSPSVLSRFKKRRFVLFFSRLAYYAISIMGVTVMPMIVSGQTAKIVWFAVLMFVANVINFLFSPGYSVWHWNFLPDRVRAGFFTQSQFLTSLVVNTLVVGVSFAADALSGTEHEMTIIIALRVAAFVFAVADCVVLALPKEYAYPMNSVRTKVSDVIRAPMGNKMFLGAIGLYCGYAMFTNLSGSVINAFLLSEVNVTYSMIYGVNALYTIFFIFFSGFWQKQIRLKGWIPSFSMSILMLSATYFLYMFITADNSIWLFWVVRLIQHFIGVGLNVTASNLHLMYMPEKDRDNFVSFYQLAANFANFVAMMLGTALVAVMEGSALRVFGLSFSSVQLLLGLQGVGFVVISFLGRKFHRAELKLGGNENA
ncbi:MAG: MFS transporter [Eubacteriales bacterium]